MTLEQRQQDLIRINEITADEARARSGLRDAAVKDEYNKYVNELLIECLERIREVSISKDRFQSNYTYIKYHTDELEGSCAYGYIMSEVIERLRQRGFKTMGDASSVGIGIRITW